MLNKYYHADCLEFLHRLPNRYVNLVLIDPPYFKFKRLKTGKPDECKWDRQWNTEEEYIKWLEQVVIELERVLKANGSFFCFASSDMASEVEVMIKKHLKVLNNIVWAKPDPDSELNKGPSKVGCFPRDKLRHYFVNTERIIFAEKFGADSTLPVIKGIPMLFETLRGYMDNELNLSNLSISELSNLLGVSKTLIRMYIKRGQWCLPTQELYHRIQEAAPGYFLRSWSDLKMEYDRLVRYFNIDSSRPRTDIWTYKTVTGYEGKHMCEKPAKMLEDMILSTTREKEIVLDCFAGSGSTLRAAAKLDRLFLGADIDLRWVNQFESYLAL